MVNVKITCKYTIYAKADGEFPISYYLAANFLVI